MTKSKTYNFVLEKGEAKKPFFKLTQSERTEIGHHIFSRVTILAKQVNSLPVTKETITKRPLRKFKAL